MNLMKEKDNIIIAYALNLWANHIETGNISLSAEDARNMNNNNLIKNLDEEQINFVKRLKDLSNKNLSS